MKTFRFTKHHCDYMGLGCQPCSITLDNKRDFHRLVEAFACDGNGFHCEGYSIIRYQFDGCLVDDGYYEQNFNIRVEVPEDNKG